MSGVFFPVFEKGAVRKLADRSFLRYFQTGSVVAPPF